MKALPIQQPHCEMILRGLKTIEYRSRRTHFRGTVYLYATKNMMDPAEAAALAKERYGVDLDAAGLPRGVLVGTVEIVDCTESDEYPGEFEWHLRNPRRLAAPKKPARMPCSPSFFEPF